MERTATEIFAQLGGTNAVARFFGVQPPSASDWLRQNAIPRARLIEVAAELEKVTAGWFTRRGQWPSEYARIWPELADPQPNTASAPAQQAPGAINSEALHTGQEVAHA